MCNLLGISPASEVFLISNFRRVLNIECNLLGISPASEVFLISNSDAGEIPKRLHTIFKTWRKFEIKNTYNQTAGKYPKDYTQYSKHGESLKSRILIIRRRGNTQKITHNIQNTAKVLNQEYL